jgi:hypothetical protein
MNLRATYEREEKHYTLSVDYTYEWEPREWDYPGSADLEVTEVYINSEPIPIEFYNDYLHDQMEDDLNEHARDLT